MTKLTLELEAYIDCIFFTDGDETELGFFDFNPESLKKAETELNEFIDKAESMGLIDNSFDMTQVAHDFWLTRNRHGAGFWDGDYSRTSLGDVGDALTDLAHSYPETSLVEGANGQLYFE